MYGTTNKRRYFTCGDIDTGIGMDTAGDTGMAGVGAAEILAGSITAAGTGDGPAEVAGGVNRIKSYKLNSVYFTH